MPVFPCPCPHTGDFRSPVSRCLEISQFQSRIWMSRMRPLLQFMHTADDLWAERRHLALQKQTGMAQGGTRPW